MRDILGSRGKSTFIRYLAANEKRFGMGIEKLPIDRPDKVRVGYYQIVKKKNLISICLISLKHEVREPG